jgi:hypothetical protein
MVRGPLGVLQVCAAGLFFSSYYKVEGIKLVLNMFNIMTCHLIARQRPDKHSAICARNNRTNVYSSFLGKSQCANGLERWLSRDLFSVWSALRNSSTVFSALSVPRLYNTSPLAAKESPGGFISWEYKDENGEWIVKIAYRLGQRSTEWL